VKEEKTLDKAANTPRLWRWCAKGCANYIAEYKECGYTDGYGCVLETSLHPCCNYFRDVVWPLDKSVPYEFGEDSKKCAQCGKAFQAGSNRAKYCPECAERQRKSNTESGSVNIWVKDDGLGFQKPRFYAAFQP